MKRLALSIALLTLVLYACDNVSIDTDLKSGEEAVDSSNNSVVAAAVYQAVEFNAVDGLAVSARLYESSDENATPIVLCHQARFNKFEYAGVAEELVALGYHCLAIDQRSGGPIADQQNETYNRAVEKGLGVDYLDAIPDITAAVQYMKDKYKKPVILWGSSYSSTLVLYEAAKNENVAAVVSFSPGDYFADTLGSLVPLLSDLEKPMFLTSGSWEAAEVSKLIAGKTLNEKQTQFIPTEDGHHGSRALWPNQQGGEEYWTAVKDWLGKL